MFIREIGVFTFSILLVSGAFAETINSIGSPDQLYLVNSRAVKQIRVVGSKDQAGDYKVEMINITGNKYYKKGYIYEKGWWYPSVQQLNSSGYAMIPSARQCDYWTDPIWSFKFVPSKDNISSNEIAFFKEIEKFHPKAKPKPKCINVKHNTDTCERIRCNEWSNPKPENYIFKSKEKALSHYSQIKNW